VNLSSKTTYIFPFILLFFSSCALIENIFGIKPNDNEIVEYSIFAIKSALLTAILFFVLKKCIGLFTKYKYLKYGLLIFPSILFIILLRYLKLDFFAIVAGLLLYYAFVVFSGRYIGNLTEETIEYKNLFGQSGSIFLKDITKLEQKKNLLSIFREFRILDLSRKTGISFCDENLDEYEIDIFTRVFMEDKIFSNIIENANKCGNLKVRQYTV
jgi:hypothetical protein